LRLVNELTLDLPPYGEFIDQRRAENKSTSRRDYFRDVLMDLNEPVRIRVLRRFIQEIERCADRELLDQIKALMAGEAAGPAGAVPAEAWGADRLNGILAQIDDAIAAGEFERAVTLSYTALEGFYGAFLRAKAPNEQAPNELIALANWIRTYLRQNVAEYPDEILNLTRSVSHAVDRARNQFSEAHFGGEAGRWMATYVRDLTNTQIRLLLHFM